MQITHEEAHKLIQFNADEALDSQAKATLASHLQQCVECRAYAQDIQEIESILSPVMKRKWNLQPVPLSIHAIAVKKASRIQVDAILTTRTAMIGIVLVAFIFSIWQFTLSGGQAVSPLPAGVLPVPTPSTQPTITRIKFQNCEETLYSVRENDTLESIAYQFSISKEEIMTMNNMKIETVNPAMKLMIPICSFTPTGTVNPATLTTTYTPIMNATTSTPNG